MDVGNRKEKKHMPYKKSLFLVLVICTAVLAAGIVPQIMASALAPPVGQGERVLAMAIPYNGQLADQAGSPVADGAYDLSFALYAGETGGAPLWSEVQDAVPVTAGAFTTALGSVNPVAPDVLTGGSHWLEVAVRGPGEAEFTALAPRQQLGPQSRSSPTQTSAGMACPHDHWGEEWNGTGTGLTLRSSSSDGLHGAASATEKSGLFGTHSGNGNGVFGRSQNGPGVGAWSANGPGVSGSSNNSDGVRGEASAVDKSGVFGNHGGNGYGVFGRSANGIGVSGWSATEAGARGETAVATSVGVVGTNLASGNYGELGTGQEGVHAVAFSPNAAGVFAQSSQGPAVHADGDLVVTGAYRGNIGPAGGAPFPRPAYDSGWRTIAKAGTVTLNHNLGGNIDNYVVDLQFRSTAAGVNIYLHGGQTWSDYLGAWWEGLTNQQIKVERHTQDPFVEEVRVRIWVYR
jgi:hypothetical protein